MRPKEVEGKDYFFVTREKFEEWIAQGQLLEHANVYGDYKGIPRQQVDQALAAGTDVVLRIDVQGAATVKKLMPDAISIFVAADSEATLVERLVSRKTETLVRVCWPSSLIYIRKIRLMHLVLFPPFPTPYLSLPFSSLPSCRTRWW
jgi:guanylate kinase